MKCNEIIELFPDILKNPLQAAKVDLWETEEIRVRAGQCLSVRVRGREWRLEVRYTVEEIRQILSYLANYSLYAYEREIRQGYLTLPGGHRLGLVGRAVLEGDRITSLMEISALNLRLAHEKKGCADSVISCLWEQDNLCDTLVVSPPGGGKTTLANIVTRFFDPQKGRVLIGNIDICDIPKETLMNKVSFVFQNSRLIKASILENVRMAKPDATREEIAHALEAAQCLDIIEKLPNGIDTVVGAKGVYLSGGEQQRIAIARAILKNAPIIILDEATAFADPDNEVRVQQALSALSKGKTVIMIAHRLSSITDADCIYVLQDGEIVESGTHSGLIERNGIFTKMWKDYSEAAEWKIAKEVNA